MMGVERKPNNDNRNETIHAMPPSTNGFVALNEAGSSHVWSPGIEPLEPITLLDRLDYLAECNTDLSILMMEQLCMR